MHIPVLLEETVFLLDIQGSDRIFEGTLGFGGHAEALCSDLSEEGVYMGVDRDQDGIAYSKERLGTPENFYFFHGNYVDIKTYLKRVKIDTVTKILLDLGMSSYQLDQSGRGFSFLQDDPLDMRMDKTEDTLSAADILNTYDVEALDSLFYQYGEIRKPQKLVQVIVSFRKDTSFTKTGDLLSCIKKGFYFRQNRRLYIRTCSQVFQALRIAVNQELEALGQFLSQVKDVLDEGGRLAIISFHSVEDRLVKEFYKSNKTWLRPVNKKVIQLSYHDAKKNVRARSAKLRVYERVQVPLG